MAASNERIREVIEAYVDRVANGTTDEVLALYADGATVEDPVGTDVRSTRESIREFYSGLEGLEQEGHLITARIAGGQAAFQFELRDQGRRPDLHAVADRRDDLRRRRQDHLDAGLLGQRRHGRQLTDSLGAEPSPTGWCPVAAPPSARTTVRSETGR